MNQNGNGSQLFQVSGKHFVRCARASMGQVKQQRIWNRKFGLAHSDTLCASPTESYSSACRLALFSFSARWLHCFLALSRYSVGFYCIHDSFSFFVASGGERMATHKHSQLGVIFSPTKIRFTRRNGPNPSGEIYLFLCFNVLCLFAIYFSFRSFLLDFRGSFIRRIQLLVLLVPVNQPPDRYFIHSFRRNDNNRDRLIVFTYLPFFFGFFGIFAFVSSGGGPRVSFLCRK